MVRNSARSDDLIHEMLAHLREHCERNAGRLTPDELEQLADFLLKICGEDPEYPCRVDLDRTTHDIRSIHDADDWFGRCAYRQPEPTRQSSLRLQALTAGLLVAAGIPSRKQREVARLHLWGYTLAETARLLGIPFTTAISRWRYAKQSLQRAVRRIPPNQWMERLLRDPHAATAHIQEAFREDQKRCLYRRPKHCPDGHERCVFTGICPGGHQPAGCKA